MKKKYKIKPLDIVKLDPDNKENKQCNSSDLGKIGVVAEVDLDDGSCNIEWMGENSSVAWIDPKLLIVIDSIPRLLSRAMGDSGSSEQGDIFFGL